MQIEANHSTLPESSFRRGSALSCWVREALTSYPGISVTRMSRKSSENKPPGAAQRDVERVALPLWIVGACG